MKQLFLSLISIVLLTTAHAQQKQEVSDRFLKPYARYMQIDFSAGTNLDMISEQDTRAGSSLLSARSSGSAPFVKATFSHFPLRRAGWYGSFQINFYDEENTGLVKSGLIEEAMTALLKGMTGPLTSMHASYDLGVIYRIEHSRWRLHPKAGLGQFGYLMKKEGYKANNEWRLTYTQKAEPLCLNLGVSGSYFISRRVYLASEVQYQKPLQESKAEVLYSTGNTETSKVSRRISTAGRCVNIGVGLGVLISE